MIDLARYLVGEITSVSASARTFMPGREVDDAFEAVVEFEGGAIGTIEATRFAAGRKNALCWEINGSKGSLAFDLERLNELQHSRGHEGLPHDPRLGGRPPVLAVVVAARPHDRLGAHVRARDPAPARRRSRGEGEVAPHGATFEDGYRAAEVCDAIVRSAASGRREAVTYRT